VFCGKQDGPRKKSASQKTEISRKSSCATSAWFRSAIPEGASSRRKAGVWFCEAPHDAVDSCGAGGRLWVPLPLVGHHNRTDRFMCTSSETRRDRSNRRIQVGSALPEQPSEIPPFMASAIKLWSEFMLPANPRTAVNERLNGLAFLVVAELLGRRA